MKRIVGTLLLLLAFVAAKSQEESSRFALIPQVGVSFGKFTGHYQIDNAEIRYRYHAGFTAGLEGLYRHDANWSFSAGVLYTQAGSSLHDFAAMPRKQHVGDAGIEWTDHSVTVGTIQIPVMANYYVAEGLALKAGVELGFAVQCKEKLTATIYEYVSENQLEAGEGQKVENDYKDKLTKTTVNIPVGASYEYENVRLDVRYHIPLMKTFKDDSTPFGNVRSPLFTATVGYRFDL